MMQVAQFRERLCERRAHPVGPSSEMRGNGGQIAQEDARRQVHRLAWFRISKQVGQCGNPGSQELCLRLGDFLERFAARALHPKAIEQLGQLVERQRAIRHAVMIPSPGFLSKTGRRLHRYEPCPRSVGKSLPMNTAITTLLSAFGLAPVSQVQQLNDDVRRTEGKIAQLEQKLEEVRADASNWKRRYKDTTEAVAGWKQATHRSQAETELMKREADRIKAELERVKADLEREQPRTAEEDAARTR